MRGAAGRARDARVRAVIQRTPVSAALSQMSVHCPDCDYILDGLGTTRCPECGRAFTIDELARPEAQRHPFLFDDYFDDAPRRFVRTYCAAHRPLLFWSSLSRMRPISAQRVILFACLCELVCALVPLAAYALFSFIQGVAARPMDARSLAWWIAQISPNPSQMVIFSVIPLVWPVLSFAILCSLRGTRRKANLHWRRALQCVAYSFPLFVTAWWVFVCLTCISVWWSDSGIGHLIWIATWCWSIGTAYEEYAGLGVPWATAFVIHGMEVFAIYTLWVAPLLLM